MRLRVCVWKCVTPPLSPWGRVVCMEQCESAAALLESVREQEVQFEQLTRALEEERRRVGLSATSPSALGRPLPYTQVTLPINNPFLEIHRLLQSPSWIVIPFIHSIHASFSPIDINHSSLRSSAWHFLHQRSASFCPHVTIKRISSLSLCLIGSVCSPSSSNESVCASA